MSDSLTKVYCINCIFFSVIEESHPVIFDFGPPEYQKQKCLSPNNFKDDFEKPQALPKSIPLVINRVNNCVWYVPKGSPSSSSSSSSSSPH